MKLAVIPARGGSKRIPRKNIKLFAGLPMIAHSLIAARESGVFDRIIVSSEDDEILAIGAEYGGEPVRRPSELADDHTPTIPVIRHVIGIVRAEGESVDGVCCIYATAPFVRATDIRLGWETLRDKQMDFTFSAATYGYPVFRSLMREGDGVRMIFPEHFPTRSQDLPETIHDAGQFYWGTAQAWLEQDRLFTEWAAPILLPRHRVQDIDTPDDWRCAEMFWRALTAPDD